MRSGKLSPVNVQVRTFGLCGGGTTDVVPPKRTDASSKMSERRSYSAHTSIIYKGEQEIVNIYHINENNLYGCLHVQLDISKERLKAVLDMGAEISLMPEKNF
jgi:hypothetical protein